MADNQKTASGGVPAHLANMTSITRAHMFGGKRLVDLEPDFEKNGKSKQGKRPEKEQAETA